MSRVTIIDSTGPNARCNKCRAVIGEAAIPYVNLWWCSKCLEAYKNRETKQAEHSQQVKRKLKKGRRTLKSYILERVQEDQVSVKTLAKEAMDNCLTTADCLHAAKTTVCATISYLRKNGYPIERVKRGVYQWRPS